jgi:serine/threonine protein phosphatase 1
MAPRLLFGDRLVYLGNYLGVGPEIFDTIAELLRFRRIFLSIPPYTDAADVVFLRGAQEEMWQKLLQVQFSARPAEVLEWMLAHGAGATLTAYGGLAVDGMNAAAQGAVALTAWTSALRARLRAAPGHNALMSALKRAVLSHDRGVLFVSAGIDTERPLLAQSDSFWWAGRSFAAITSQYEGFARIVRGFDPGHNGYLATEATLTIDGGCGFNGNLIAVCMTPDGKILERLDV